MRYLEIYLIRTFATFVEKKGISSTAKALHLTEAAVCQQLKKVESYFPFAIFERRGSGRYLTERGKDIYARTVELLNLAAGIRRLAENVGARRLRLAVDSYLCSCGFSYWELMDGFALDIGVVQSVDCTAAADRLARCEVDAFLGCACSIPAGATAAGRVEYAWYGDPSLLSRPAVPVALNISPAALALSQQQMLSELRLQCQPFCETDDYRLMTELVRQHKCIALLPRTGLTSNLDHLAIGRLPAAAFHHVYFSATWDIPWGSRRPSEEAGRTGVAPREPGLAVSARPADARTARVAIP